MLSRVTGEEYDVARGFRAYGMPVTEDGSVPEGAFEIRDSEDER